MYLKIFLCSSAFVVASANNVIPAQTYPIYQQNGYMNPQGNQPNNIQPYLQGVTAQNQLQPLNISPSLIKQALLNRLLTGQSVETIIDPNSKSYGATLGRVQNNQIPANPTNNYFVVAQDNSKNNTSSANIYSKTNDINTEKPKHSKRKSKSRTKQRVKSAETRQETVPNKLDDRRLENNENITENNKNSRKNTRKRRLQATEVKKETDNAENRNKRNRTRRRKKKQKDQIVENPVKEESIVQNTTSPKRRKKQRVNKNSESENQINTQSKSKEIIENMDLDITMEGIANENRLIRNSKHDPNDIIKSTPNKPKEMTNNFLSTLNQFNNPLMGNWLANFENIYQSLGNQQTTNEVRPKRRRKPKRKIKNKTKSIHSKNITEEATTTENSNTFGVDATTTERIVCVNEIIKTNINSNPTEESPKLFENENSMKTSSNEIFRDGYNIHEFEDRYDTEYNGGYFDDYYPQFMDSAAYYANNKEIILKNINDNKYYYATDIIDTELTKKRQDYNQELTEQVVVDYEKSRHTYDDSEKESIRSAYKKDFDEEVEEKLQFRTPPQLESPDFRTRQIDKSEIKPEVHYVFANSFDKFVEDKSSSYSNAKMPYNSGFKRNDIKMQPKDVETVYAKSKVVSYGPVYTPGGDSLSSTSNVSPWIDPNFTNESFDSGESTFVIAKSLDPSAVY